MSPINTANLTASPVVNQIIPDEGPKAVPILLDFSGAQISYTLNLLLQQQGALISMVQTVFIDLSNAAHDLLITAGVNVLNQVIHAKAGTQGYYPILCPSPPQITFTAGALGDVVPVVLINIPIAGVVWTA